MEEYFSDYYILFQVVGEQCCIEKGVPVRCLGFCMKKLKKLHPSAFNGMDDVSACTPYDKIAAECRAGTSEGNLIVFLFSNLNIFVLHSSISR